MDIYNLYTSSKHSTLLKYTLCDSLSPEQHHALTSFLNEIITAITNERASLLPESDNFVLRFTRLQAREFAFREFLSFIQTLKEEVDDDET